MPNFRSAFMSGTTPVPVPSGPENITIEAPVATPGSLALNDVLEFFDLPAGALPVDFVLDSTDIDSGTAIVMSVGFLNAGKTAILVDAPSGGAAWLTGATIGQAGGIVRPTVPAMFRVTPTAAARTIGVLITTAAGTPAAGTVTLSMVYRASRYGA